VRRSGSGLAFLLLLTAACDQQESLPSQAGRLEVQWTGADTGRISANASAEWCADRRWLEIRAVQGDTGVAMALYPVDSVVPDSYPVVEPTRADSARPTASLGLRLFSQTAVKGYRGDSGAVLLERSGSRHLSGRLTARARGVPNGEQIRLSGKFERVALLPQERGCTPELPDTVTDTTEAAGPASEQVD
jgi:hypothetical protein